MGVVGNKTFLFLDCLPRAPRALEFPGREVGKHVLERELSKNKSLEAREITARVNCKHSVLGDV